MDLLRTEIIEAQKARADLLKWKLVIVAAVGGVGLGLSTTTPASPLILILIPLACFYVDLLCQQMNLRIQLIAQFTRLSRSSGVNKETDLMKEYECYVLLMAREGEADVFRLESWALQWSTLVLSTMVAAYGVWLALATHVAPFGVSLFVFGLAGLPLSIFSERLYRKRRQRIERSDLGGCTSEHAARNPSVSVKSYRQALVRKR